MKYEEVQRILHVTRQTLSRYVREGKIRVTRLPNGRCLYNGDDVYAMIGVDRRKNVIYGRVSTQKQAESLKTQIETIRLYANANGYTIDAEYKDIASGMHFDRNNFKLLVNEVISGNVRNVFILHKDRLTRISFDMWKELFEHFNCRIVVINQEEDDDKGIFEDIISMLHCFSIKMYSNRRKKKLNIIADDLNYTNEE